MRKISKKLKALIMALILILISAIVIIINGNTYTLEIHNNNLPKDIEKINVSIEKENIAKCIGKELDDGVLKVDIKSISKGKTYLDINSLDGETYHLDTIYVHGFGVITINTYLGDCNYSIIIPISFVIWLIYVLYMLIVSYRESVRENMYQYKNIAYMGLIIFISISIISQILNLFNYMGLINTINEMINYFSFAIIIFPVSLIVSILMIISNISLIRKEGFNVRNLLGLVLGIFLCFTTILPDLLYNMLYTSSWIDIHNQNGIGVYIYNMVESIIYIIITYIECVLIGTIIMGLKAAKHIPKFDKDYIIILGCQIRKDGTLTNLLKGRVDRAIEFSKMQKEKTGKDIVFVPSGGQGSDEVISEAQAMKNYLLTQGIKEKDIIIENKSKNTFENINFSNSIIKDNKPNANIAFSTTNYHVYRVGSIASEQNIHIEGIGSKTKSYFWINAFIREFIATLFSEKKNHLFVLSCIILFISLMVYITYLNNSL